MLLPGACYTWLNSYRRQLAEDPLAHYACDEGRRVEQQQGNGWSNASGKAGGSWVVHGSAQGAVCHRLGA